MTQCNLGYQVVVSIQHPEGKNRLRVSGPWSGGYLHGFSWKFSGGTEKIE